ncbi:MAG TPA: hypothetical protein VFH95_13305, partial [Candidatus Kapabacteria bacterium]|nr:hypothetical protein [Candidatus Kapabacteria bacterium]
DLVTRIHEKAIDRKLEPHLQKVLQKQGLSTKENWHLKPKFISAPFADTPLSVKENGHTKVT